MTEQDEPHLCHTCYMTHDPRTAEYAAWLDRRNRVQPDTDRLAVLLAQGHDNLYAPILLPEEYKRFARFLIVAGVTLDPRPDCICPEEVARLAGHYNRCPQSPHYEKYRPPREAKS